MNYYGVILAIIYRIWTASSFLHLLYGFIWKNLNRDVTQLRKGIYFSFEFTNTEWLHQFLISHWSLKACLFESFMSRKFWKTPRALILMKYVHSMYVADKLKKYWRADRQTNTSCYEIQVLNNWGVTWTVCSYCDSISVHQTIHSSSTDSLYCWSISTEQEIGHVALSQDPVCHGSLWGTPLSSSFM